MKYTTNLTHTEQYDIFTAEAENSRQTVGKLSAYVFKAESDDDVLEVLRYMSEDASLAINALRKTVGYRQTQFPITVSYISLWYVNPDYRRQGIGSKLLDMEHDYMSKQDNPAETIYVYPHKEENGHRISNIALHGIRGTMAKILSEKDFHKVKDTYNMYTNVFVNTPKRR